jgi:4-hydroxy-3-methylbut-2-enyl diphosphate reductase IspH
MTTSEVILVSDKDSANKAEEEQIAAGVPKESIKIARVDRQRNHSVEGVHEVSVTNQTESPAWVVMIISKEAD